MKHFSPLSLTTTFLSLIACQASVGRFLRGRDSVGDDLVRTSLDHKLAALVGRSLAHEGGTFKPQRDPEIEIFPIFLDTRDIADPAAGGTIPATKDEFPAFLDAIKQQSPSLGRHLAEKQQECAITGR